MWNDLSSYAAWTRPKSLGKVLQKYQYKNKRLIFRKVAVLEPATLLK